MNAKELGAQPVVYIPISNGKTTGLTKREHFAAMAMQGILANSLWQKDQQSESKRLASAARFYADALLAELAKDQP